MRTNIYVDGFNLYKAALTKTSYKWLDLHRLLADFVIPPSQPTSVVTQIKYFTARVKGSLSRNPESPNRQHRYMLALEKYHEGLVSIIEGDHSEVETSGRLIEPEDNSHFRGWVKIEKMEEKQTDVNIALHMYRDCSLNQCDHVVLVSNDSDLAPAIELIKKDFPNIVCGVVIPNTSRKSRSLTNLADWARDGLTEQELSDSQLPPSIEYRTGKKMKRKQLHKPEGW